MMVTESVTSIKVQFAHERGRWPDQRYVPVKAQVRTHTGLTLHIDPNEAIVAMLSQVSVNAPRTK